ncbi:MAG: tetratricopeptide repeat protein [Thermodesulfobacteriota bacterium]
MPSIDEIRDALYRAAALPDADLAAAALLVAAEEYPELDHARYLSFLDEIADSLRRRLGDDGDPERVRRATCEELFVRHRFAGDTEDYYDPRNSYLNEVIDRRRGIPITLAVVYIAVGTRLGQPVHGVNAPGHFLVRHGDVVLDPFAGGRVVERPVLAAQLAQLGVENAEQQVARLLDAPPDTRAVLVRILGNLKANHLQRKDFSRALAVVDRLVHLDPRNPLWLRDRGALYQRLDCPHAAVADFERYLALVPDDPEGDVIRETVVKLSRNAPTLQ